jgi:hypothetical protein
MAMETERYFRSITIGGRRCARRLYAPIDSAG